MPGRRSDPAELPEPDWCKRAPLGQNFNAAASGSDVGSRIWLMGNFVHGAEGNQSLPSVQIADHVRRNYPASKVGDTAQQSSAISERGPLNNSKGRHQPRGQNPLSQKRLRVVMCEKSSAIRQLKQFGQTQREACLVVLGGQERVQFHCPYNYGNPLQSWLGCAEPRVLGLQIARTDNSERQHSVCGTIAEALQIGRP